MMFGRRGNTPIWVWVLALLGLKSLWVRRQEVMDPAVRAKRERFRAKLDEAFQVWRDDSSGE